MALNGQDRRPVIGNLWVRSHPTVLRLAKRVESKSGDDADVTDQHGFVTFRVQCLSGLQPRRQVVAADGTVVLTLQEALVAGSWQVFRGDSTKAADRVATIKPKLLSYKPNLRVYLQQGDRHEPGDKSNQEPDFVVRGDSETAQRKTFQISQKAARGEQVVGVLRQTHWFVRQEGMDYKRNRYNLQVAPGMDVAFMLALCVVADKKFCTSYGGAGDAFC
jgi:uncharacterized protein YxjI